MSEAYKKKRRQEILDIARKVFIEKGFEHTTMTDIVEASGLSRGGVYQYFSSTDEMFREITNFNDHEHGDWIDQVIGESHSAWEALDRLLKENEAGLLNDSIGFGIVQFEYFVNSTRREDRASYLNKRYLSAVKSFSKFIRHGVETGEFKPIQPIEAITLFIINVLDGTHLQRVMTLNHIGPADVYVTEQIDSLRMYLKQVLQVDS
ncbi:TetR family transcriptional regulator [Peribacillus sp. SCS-37]|uniref:TetR family transcriptional regulator n=1 Tax=Paraperibacillus esterisolvens TaxID=3115296 RepID=UPI0039064F85